MRRSFLAILLAATVASPAFARVTVHSSNRYLVDGEGKPFFWLADTGWQIASKTTRQDAELYLATRAKQGFTVIQAAVVMGEEFGGIGGTRMPNLYGDTAFVDGDLLRPNVTPGARPDVPAEYDYWDHVDFIVDAAEKKGLVLGLLPLFVGFKAFGYKYITPANAEGYGKFLGERYKGKNIVWLLGGDHVPKEESQRTTWTLMAKGITTGVAGSEDYAATTMTYHVSGGATSADWWHAAPWLDFNMLQVWGDYTLIYKSLIKDRDRTPPKPFGLGEGSYEDGPEYISRPINPLLVRRQAYWSYFAGGYHTYGNTNVWGFGSYRPNFTQDWKRALKSPGAQNLVVLKKLFDSLPWWEFEPSPQVRVRMGEIGTANPGHVAMRTKDGAGIMVYLIGPDHVTIDMTKLTGAGKAKVAWFDPRNGSRRAAGEFALTGEQTFTTPKGWEDALLILDAGLPLPHR